MDLDFETGTVRHVHVFGHTGVGKTRFVLELCRDARWQSFVLYLRQASDLRLHELLDSCASQPDVRLVLVADEVQLDQIVPLSDSVARADGRVRLVTIGPTPSPDPERVPNFEVKPLPENVVAEVVRRWHPGMPAEHAEFVARFSAGYVRLARLAASAVHRNPDMDVRRILEQQEIRGFLDKMLGDGDRSSLYAVAVLTSIGWTGEREVEGRTVAEHLGLNWARVRTDVERYERRFHIAPRSGRLRNISPSPLGVYLALEAWSNFQRELSSLPAKLPEAAVAAYYERLEALASSPQAGTFAREELDGFFPVADLNDVRAIRRWSALAFADPGTAASRMRAELARRSVEERAAIRRQARIALVSGLVALAWSSPTFEDAVHGLALLAAAENDDVSSNATDGFLQRFSIFFSATAVPYAVRMRVLDELFASTSPELRRLAFRAMARVATRQGFRTHRTPITRGLPEQEWQPTTNGELLAAARLGIERMRRAVETGEPALREIAGAVVGELHMLLLQEPVRAPVIDLIAATARVFSSQREVLRRSIADLLFKDRKHWHRLGAEGEAAVEALVRDLEDQSLGGRLLQLVGPGSRQEDEPAIQVVATDLTADPTPLAEEWHWITGGTGSRAWALGAALGASNLDEVIQRLVESEAMGLDGRVVCAYLRRRAADAGADWLERWLDNLWSHRRDRANLVLEATWRLTPTHRGRRRVLEIIERGAGTAAVIGQLAYGTWGEQFTPDELLPVVEALVRRPDGIGAALGMVGQRVRKNADELETWSEIALAIVTNGSLIRAANHDSWEWKELASPLVASHPRELYRAILQEQGGRPDGSHWFLEHELAAEVVQACVERDPAGTWEETRPHLERERAEVLVFQVGFPEGLVDLMDNDEIMRWVEQDPEARALVIPRFVAKRYGDDTLAGRLIERYGTDEEVARIFQSQLMSGSWIGSSAEHWAGIARGMRDVSVKAHGAGLRRWAARSAELLEQMAGRDREREEEERVR